MLLCARIRPWAPTAVRCLSTAVEPAAAVPRSAALPARDAQIARLAAEEFDVLVVGGGATGAGGGAGRAAPRALDGAGRARRLLLRDLLAQHQAHLGGHSLHRHRGGAAAPGEQSAQSGRRRERLLGRIQDGARRAQGAPPAPREQPTPHQLGAHCCADDLVGDMAPSVRPPDLLHRYVTAAPALCVYTTRAYVLTCVRACVAGVSVSLSDTFG